jgi:elongator complex protein 2
MVSLSLPVLPEKGGHLSLVMGGLDHKIHNYGSKSLDYSLPVMMGSEKHNIFLVSSS